MYMKMVIEAADLFKMRILEIDWPRTLLRMYQNVMFTTNKMIGRKLIVKRRE